jgi:hypothetical protein
MYDLQTLMNQSIISMFNALNNESKNRLKFVTMFLGINNFFLNQQSK